MQIPLRSPDAVRRLVDRFDHIAWHWPHHKRLLALAAMYGYPSWEALVAQCVPTAPRLIYDQDLPSDAARQERWLAMARQVAASLSLLLPEAINLVKSVVPTMKMGVEHSIWYESNDVFDRALQEDKDVWWICYCHYGHHLVPPGFALSRAIRIAEVAERRLSEQLVQDTPYEELYVLDPTHVVGRVDHTQTYSRRRDLIVVEPVPFADALLSPKTMAKHLHQFFAEDCPSWTDTMREQKLAEWIAAGKALKVAAGLPASSKKRWIQTTISARKKIKQSWHWPLRIIETDPLAVEAGRSEAERMDKYLSERYGGDPGYIVITN